MPYGLEWDISKAGRCKVSIEPSQKGTDVRINQRGVYTELKQSTRDPLMAAVYDTFISNTIEKSEEEKAETDKALELVKKEAATAKMLNIAQMEMQLQQMSSPQQVQEGQDQQIAGAEGAVPTPDGQPAQPPVSPGKQPNLKEGIKGTPLENSAQLAKVTKNVQQSPVPGQLPQTTNQ
jgi:hypothetical protein